MTEQLVVPAAHDAGDPPVESKAEPSVGEYRYPGAPPFADSKMDRLLFRGRTTEIDQVLHSILSFDLFLIYAVSGLGKTSLLSAGVAEPLRQRDFFPVLIRLNDPARSPVELIDAQLREAAARDDAITVTQHPSLRDVELPPATLWDLLSGLEVWRGNTLQHLVLIFDQFEELFTLGWSDDQRTQFIEQFGQIVRRHRPLPAGPEAARAELLPAPTVKITLVIREDFLGELEAMAQHVPQIMRHRFRLDGLQPEQAERAIREPARVSDPRLTTPQFGYSEGAARAILAFLGARQERGRPVLTQTVDPSQLQIICQHVERSILPTKPVPDADSVVEISEDDLGGKNGLERILHDFYRREISTFPAGQRKLVRHLCETGLINQRGRRLSLEEEEIGANFKVTKATLEELVARRLLRAEPRVGSIYYELAHDTLAAPIMAHRDEVRSARRRRWLGAAGGLVAIVALIVVIRAMSSGPGPESIVIGQSVPGTIDSSGNSRELQFDAPSGQSLSVDVQPAVGVDAIVKLTDPDGNVEWTDDASEGGAERALVGETLSGRYKIMVQGGSSGSFTLLVHRIEVVEVTIGKATSGTFDAGNPVAVFAFEAAADQTLLVEAKPETGATFDATLEVTDPETFVESGNAVSEGGAQNVLLAGTREGRYLVVVRGQSGAFELTVRPAKVVEMTVDGPTVQSTIGPADPVRVFTFEATDDRPVIVEVKPGPSLDASLQVTDPNDVVQSADDVLKGGTETVLLDGTAQGTYRGVVSGQSSGSFELTVRRAEVVDMTVDGPPASATLGPADPVGLFTFEATDDRPLVVEVKPESGLDASLEITDPNDAVQWADDALEAGTETVLLDGTAQGTYRVVVSGQSSGAFELSVRRAAVIDATVGDRPMPATIGANSPIAVFEFEPPDEQTFIVEVEPDTGFDAMLQVTDPSRNIDEEDFGAEGGTETAVVDGTRSGRYLLVVRGYESNTGGFKLSVRTADVVRMAIGDTNQASIDASIPVAVFEFDAPADRTIVVDLKPEPSLHAVLQWIDSNGFIEATNNQDEGGPETLQVDSTIGGRYLVVVRGYKSTTGGFVLSAHSP